MSSSVRLHTRKPDSPNPIANVLPQLIQTPTGLALLELQGTINTPHDDGEAEGRSPEIDIGRISFPDYNPNALDPSNTSWMKCVQFYVGQHQRLTGEVKKLPKPLAVIRKRTTYGEDTAVASSGAEEKNEDLEIIEIVKYKIVFSQRPEPVGSS